MKTVFLLLSISTFLFHTTSQSRLYLFVTGDQATNNSIQHADGNNEFNFDFSTNQVIWEVCERCQTTFTYHNSVITIPLAYSCSTLPISCNGAALDLNTRVKNLIVNGSFDVSNLGWGVTKLTNQNNGKFLIFGAKYP